MIKPVKIIEKTSLYIYVRKGKEFVTPNFNVATYRKEKNSTIFVVENGKHVEAI